MQITINAPDTFSEERLQQLIKQIEINLAKKAVLENDTENIAWNLGKDLFNKHSSGQGNLAKDRKKIIREKLYAKHCLN